MVLPVLAPYPYGYYDYAPETGAVKFDTSVKDAEVYINGAYAGTVGKLKTMQLRPGSYDIEVRAPGCTQFDKKVYVAAGKTLHLNPDLRVQPRPQVQP
jgi:PEGA domain